MEKKDLTFTIIFIIAVCVLVYFLRVSITGYVTLEPVETSPAEINTYLLISFIVLIIGMIYFLRRKGE